MNSALSLEAVLKRDRAVVAGGIAALACIAWSYMLHEVHAMRQTGVCSCAGMAMSGPDLAAWSPATILPIFLMWAEMMLAMMLPSATPMLLTFALVNRKRREQERPFVSTSIFLLGYLIAWTAFSAVAAAAQWILHGKALLSPMMASTSPWLGGSLLLLAGVFQWTPLKHSCLAHCRSPIDFLTTSWREGRWGALMMGLKHGAYCLGCCWILMALLFVAGVMNILWIALISILVLIEKIAPKHYGLLLGRMAGVALAAWGAWLIAGALR